MKCSKVICLFKFLDELTTALTFENLCQIESATNALEDLLAGSNSFDTQVSCVHVSVPVGGRGCGWFVCGSFVILVGLKTGVWHMGVWHSWWWSALLCCAIEVGWACSQG